MKRFYSDCVGWPKADVRDGLMAMVDGGRQITRGTFLRHVDRGGVAELEERLGYGAWMRMSGDRYVRYFKGKLHGKVAVWFEHSAIEYVFV